MVTPLIPAPRRNVSNITGPNYHPGQRLYSKGCDTKYQLSSLLSIPDKLLEKNSLIQSVSFIERESKTVHFGITKQVMHPYYIMIAIMQLNIVKASRLSVFKHAFYFKQHLNALRSHQIKHFYVSIQWL